MTRRLPTPVQMVVDSALHLAVRRWPPSLRDELSREWAAELHTIAHEPRVTAAVRSWRSLAFTVSLVCARGIEKEEHVEGRSLMRTTSKPLIDLALVPVMMTVLIAFAFIAVTILQETYLDPIMSFSSEAFMLQDMGAPAAAIAAVTSGLLGRRWARRSPLPFPHLTARAVAAVAGLMAGVVAVIGLTAPIGSALLGRSYRMELVYLLIWATLFALSLKIAQRLPERWTWATVAAGGFVAWYLGQLLVIFVVEGLRMSSIGAPIYITLGGAWLMPSLLLGLTVFTLTYLRGSRMQDTEPSKDPDPVTT